jgi:hypothetical protein
MKPFGVNPAYPICAVGAVESDHEEVQGWGITPQPFI